MAYVSWVTRSCMAINLLAMLESWILIDVGKYCGAFCARGLATARI